MEPLQIFENFKLEDLDPGWIQSVWDGDFLRFEEIPGDYLMYVHSEDMGELLKQSYVIVKKEMSEAIGSSEKEKQEPRFSWQDLLMVNVDIRSLLPVIGYILKSGQNIRADEDSRQNCLKATSLYFVLLTVPGSNACNVFHPNLYQRALGSLKLFDMLFERKLDKSFSLDDFSEDEDEHMEVSLPQTEKITLIRGLNGVMYDLILMLKSFCMRDQVRSLEITVQTLLEIAKLETNKNHLESEFNGTEASISSLSYNAYAALEELCNSKHGPVKDTTRLIAKYVLPYLLSSYTELPYKAINVVRETMIHFMRNLHFAHEKHARLGLVTLIQHLMIQCPERSDPRQKQAATIVKLINCCRKSMLCEGMENLILLAHQKKVTFRIFAQEIIFKFLTERLQDRDDLTEVSEALRMKLRKILIATALSRCVDISSMVRGRAMATIAEYSNSSDNTGIMTMEDIFKTSDQEAPLPLLEQLRCAIFKDVNPLPGSNTIISMLMSRVEDERALVRRSAIQILRNLSGSIPGILDRTIFITGSHCRDPSLAVRVFAIQTLTQLLKQFPGHRKLPEEWVRSVVPQIFDIEVKVQEKVLESLESLVLNKIRHVSKSNRRKDDVMNNLPWKIIRQLTRMKMRKHLSKACNIWMQQNNIADSVILDIQSHFGTQNDVSAWVLLAALSENKKIPVKKEHFSNYEKLMQGDSFVTCLTLEVLRNSWSSLDDEFLEKLYSHMWDCLIKFTVSFQLISLSLDILNGVIRHLHPENGEEMVQGRAMELMKCSEAHLEKIFSAQEQTEELGSVYLKALCTLGHSSTLGTGSISTLTLTILQGLLLEWDSLPEAIKRVKELQAAAVALLGQQAMRDFEIAKEIVPILGQLMRNSTNGSSKTEPAIKVNAAKALADLCVRFTALVEPYLPDMCICMKDANPVVRETIVILFIQLLLEDFIKVKGPFFFHILTMLSDTDETIRELTIFLVRERLLAKNKTLVSQQFIESLFHYNNYRPQGLFNNRRITDRERHVLTLSGQKNQTKRWKIYDFMLEHLDPEQKFNLIAKLSYEILGGTLTSVINVRVKGGECVFKDALYILASEHLQLSSFNKHSEDEALEEPASLTSTNSGVSLVVNKIKDHGLKNLLPILVKLKKKLAKFDTPLLADVRRYLVKVALDYNKEQLGHLFVKYPNLEKEIANDTKKYGKKMRLNEEALDGEENSITARDSPSRNSASPSVINIDKTCKIVLRRLSSLTYPGISEWRSPSRSSLCSERSCQPGPSGFQRFLATPSPCQPGPSHSTPKSGTEADRFMSSLHSPIFMQDQRASESCEEEDCEEMPALQITPESSGESGDASTIVERTTLEVAKQVSTQ
ncbi:condensin-2 complex subunit D3 [Orussus abietinus]|uniref:condensin-2 complex subunit D3 n=1 Tax=Orussus abietinus TaxID=222816 RepID=UPI000626BF3B|nr:condensin-2 complex subunit D3 [Orussus abietinus]